MTYSVLAAYDNNLLTGSKYTDYEKALMKFHSQFSSNIANHNVALEMIIDEYGNVLKQEYYAKEIHDEPEATE